MGKARSNVRHLERVLAPTLADETLTRVYGVAMLRMALELKRAPLASFEAVVARVLTKMRLNPAHFRAYLEQNGELLRSASGRAGLKRSF